MEKAFKQNMNNKDASMDLEVRDLILQFEKQCDPFKYQVEGFCIWPVFRFISFENLKINKAGYTLRQVPKKRNMVIILKEFLLTIPKELTKLIKFYFNKNKIDILAFTSSDRLRGQDNEVYKNIYFDFFDPPLKNVLYWYNISGHEDRLNKYYSPFLNGKIWVIGIVLGGFKYKKYIKTVHSLYEDFTGYLEGIKYRKLFDLDLSLWTDNLMVFLCQKYLFKYLLKLFTPKILLVECAYSKEGAVAAAKSMNIPVWELQHGVFYDGHMAYTYDEDSAGNYRTKLPFPDKILTFGMYFSQAITKRGFWHEYDVPPVGFPVLEDFRKKHLYKKDNEMSELNVLISSQWILVDKIVSFLQQVIPELPEGILIKVKPHPLESQEHIKQYASLEGAVEIINKNKGFYDVLMECHVHCAVFSTTLLESIGMEIPTMIINLPGAEHVSSIAKYGCARIAHSPSDFVHILQRSKSEKDYLKKWREEMLENQSYLWEPEPGSKFQILTSKVF
jgi:hypothetical protein